MYKPFYNLYQTKTIFRKLMLYVCIDNIQNGLFFKWKTQSTFNLKKLVQKQFLCLFKLIIILKSSSEAVIQAMAG